MGVALAGRRRLIWLGVAVVVLALVAFGAVRALTAGAAREESKAAETVKVDKGAVSTEVATTGTLQAAQTRSLSFAVSAEVETVKVRAGTTVTAGQVLATVDDTDAAEDVEDAQDTLDEAEEALTKASSTTSSSGCDVAAAYTASASPSASSSPSASAPATASPSPAVTRTTTSKPRATATKSCSASGASRGGSSDSILSAEQRVNAAEVALEEAEEALDGTRIIAPIAGKVISVSGKVGSTVKSGSTFITLADVYDMQISADFPEADADRLAVTQKAVITLADRAGETFDATVVQVDPVGTSDGTLTRFGVVLSFDDAPEELLVGQSANVRVTTGSKENVLRVPSTAVHDVSGEDGTVLKDGVATRIKLGLRGDQYTEIVSGLAEGDAVARSW